MFDGQALARYHRVKPALSPHLPLPLRNQLLLIQSDILSIALYPTAVKDLDYKSLDVFVNRLLNRITGCSQRFTSATFLRAELGVPSSKYLADMRALCYDGSWPTLAGSRTLFWPCMGMGPFSGWST